MQIQQNAPFTDEQKKLSFVITTYNISPDMLRQCVESILSLSLTPEEREIILVDDGSDESPLVGLKDYINDLIYVRQENKGVSGARNIGIRLASGSHIQFIDGDDHLIPEAYEHCLSIWKNNNPDIIAFDRTSGEEKEPEITVLGPVEGVEYMLHNNIYGAIWGYIFRRSMLISLKFTIGVDYGEDEEFTPQLLLRAESMYATNAKAYFYRLHDTSITHKKEDKDKLKRLDDSFNVICRLQYKADRLPTKEREALSRRVAQLTMDYIYNVIILTHDVDTLESRVKRLHEKGLFPLPDKDYTRKYKWFRWTVSTALGRKLLLYSLKNRDK